MAEWSRYWNRNLKDGSNPHEKFGSPSLGKAAWEAVKPALYPILPARPIKCFCTAMQWGISHNFAKGRRRNFFYSSSISSYPGPFARAGQKRTGPINNTLLTLTRRARCPSPILPKIAKTESELKPKPILWKMLVDQCQAVTSLDHLSIKSCLKSNVFEVISSNPCS